MTTGTEPQLMSPELIADPYTGFGRLREEAPVLRGRAMDGSPAWYVTRQHEVRLVLSDPRFVNDATSVPGVVVDSVRRNVLESFGVSDDLARYFTDSILGYDGADHLRLRKLVSRAFTVRRVTGLRPRVAEIAAGLLDGLDAAGAGEPAPVDLVERFAYPLPITVICELVGVPEADRPSWREWGATLLSMDPTRLAGALQSMVDHSRELIARRRSAPADDLLSALIQAQEDDGDRLSETELITMVFTLVMAGHETTAHLISNGAYALLTHPDQLDLLRREPERWPAAVHELMRWCGPVLAPQIRYASADVELGGVTIRTGEVVQAVLVSANRDPREYTDPDRLDVTRRLSGRGEGHVGFGYGTHYCLGAALARQEGEVALHALFDRFPRLRLASDQAEWARVPGMRRLVRMPVFLR